MEYNSSEQIFNEIARIVPAYSGMSYARIEKEKGVQWNFGARAESKMYLLHAKDGGKPRFHIVDFRLPDKGDLPFTLVAGNIMKEYFHYTGDLDPVKKGVGMMNPMDAEGIGIEDSGTVKITSSVGSITFPVKLETDIPRGMLSIPFHPSGEKVSRLISSDTEPASGIPAYKSGAVKIEAYSK